MSEPEASKGFRDRLYHVIFGTNTPAGKNFDIALIVAIITSVIVVFLTSIEHVNDRYGKLFYALEWFFTLLFTVEYFARLYCSPKPKAYATSFYGVVDLLSILPSYIALFLAGTQYLVVVRILRVLRIFRVLKLFRYSSEATLLVRSFIAARRKIIVFLSVVVAVVILIGTLMFAIEGPANGFTSLPRSMYWAIITITTVGYGDITPQTPMGQALASFTMIIAYGIIAIPTGIVGAELIEEYQRDAALRQCQQCHRGNHQKDAKYCRVCGEQLPEPSDKNKP